MSRRSPLRPAQPRGLRVSCRTHPDAKLVSDYESGDMICPECGLVVGDRLVDPGAEWRTFSDGPNNSRVGNPEDPYYESGGLGTIIGPSSGKDGISKYAKFAKESARDRSLRAAFKDMNDCAQRIHLPGIIMETARGLYKEVHDRVKSAGDHKGALGIACMFLACRIEKVPRTFKEICDSSPYPKRKIGACFKQIAKLLSYRESGTPVENTELDFMGRFGTKLEVKRATLELATHIATKAVEEDLFPSKGPDVICAASILLASVARGDNNTLKDLVDVSGASRHGIYQAYRQVAKLAKDLFPASPDFEPAIPWEDMPGAVTL